MLCGFCELCRHCLISVPLFLSEKFLRSELASPVLFNDKKTRRFLERFCLFTEGNY